MFAGHIQTARTFYYSYAALRCEVRIGVNHGSFAVAGLWTGPFHSRSRGPTLILRNAVCDEGSQPLRPASKPSRPEGPTQPLNQLQCGFAASFAASALLCRSAARFSRS